MYVNERWGFYMQKIMKMNQRDTVAVALHAIEAGENISIDGALVTVTAPIKQGHKIALTDFAENEVVIKYGYPIGRAKAPIQSGEWVHTHNLATTLSGAEEYEFKQELYPVDFVDRKLTFQGFRRDNGKVGIRNDLLIIPTVGCVNGIAEMMVRMFKDKYPKLTGIDHISILKHPYGCSQLGDDHIMTRTILVDAALHPNAGGVLVLGLGCENNLVSEFKKAMGDYLPARVKFLVAQEHEDEIEVGLTLLEELYAVAKQDQREEIPLSELNVGLKCGGSDGFSGITANPLLGVFSDFLIAQGGTTVLTEVPEMFGAERVLMARAENEEVFKQIVRLINDFKAYYLKHDEPVYENPSPGNKDGGISTLEDKSLGCVQKAGIAPVKDVLLYGEKIRTKGLNLLQGPGNDLIATSALAASDCHLVLFTTGRGTPFGSFVPTVKVATNNRLFERKGNWMDFNAGTLLERPMPEVLEEFISYLLGVASGKPTKNEENDIREISIFKNGVTL